MSETNWVSIVALCGALVLAGSAFRGHRVGTSRMIVMALAWVAIFLVAAAVFSMAGGRSFP